MLLEVWGCGFALSTLSLSLSRTLSLKHSLTNLATMVQLGPFDSSKVPTPYPPSYTTPSSSPSPLLPPRSQPLLWACVHIVCRSIGRGVMCGGMVSPNVVTQSPLNTRGCAPCREVSCRRHCLNIVGMRLSVPRAMMSCPATVQCLSQLHGVCGWEKHVNKRVAN